MDYPKQLPDYLDLDQRAEILQGIYMPTVPAKSRAPKGQRVQHEGEGQSKKRKKRDDRQVSSFRRAYRGTADTENDAEDDRKKLDDKLLEELSECLQNCSRQRLRAVHMSMRQYGNEASRIASKDVVISLQDNSVQIHDRIVKTLIDKFEDSKGVICLEDLYKFLVEAHSKTGRDSVLAMRKRNDLAPKYDVKQEEIDEDLIWRIEALLIKSQSYIDIQDLREAFRARDTQNTGKVETSVAHQICLDHQMPVFGALLKNLMKRCDDQKNDKINWPEFLSFLEAGQQNAWLQCPELKKIPEKLKSQTPVQPSVLDELSARTRNTLVNKLRKKASIKKQEQSETESKSKVSDASENKENAKESKNNEMLKAVHEPVSDNTIREEPYIEIDKKTQLTKVIIDIVPPDNEATDENGKGQSKDSTSTQNLSVTSSNKNSNSQAILSSPNEGNKGGINPVVSENIPLETDPNTSRKEGQDVKAAVKNQAHFEDSHVIQEIVRSKEPVTSEMKIEDTVRFTVQGQEVIFKVPSEYLGNQMLDPPTERLRMEWVYGYRGNDCRKNIHVLASGEMIYFMSYIAIVYNRAAHHQKHYTEHTDDIKSIDVHTDGLTVATGQFASRKNSKIEAHIRIWRSDTLQTLHILGMGEFERAVACIAFSPEKDLLAAVDNSLEKKLTIWDTSSGEKKGEEILHTELICEIDFYGNDSETLVTIGKEHISWWKVYPDSSSIQTVAKPEYEGFLRAKFVICLTFNDRGDLITGDSNGTIYVWGAGGNKITNYVKHAHDGPVFTVLCYKGYLFSGGRDGILHCWQFNKNMDAAGFLQLPPTDGGIRMLQIQDDALILGTTMNSLHQVPLNCSADKSPLSGTGIDSSPITQCHYDDLRGLVTLPNAAGYDVLTAGLDGIICSFDTNSCKAISKVQMKGNQYLCIDADETGVLVALGTKDGHIHIMHHKDDQWEEVINQKICRDKLNIIRISPDKKYIAAGGQDTNIYVLVLQTKDDGTSVWEYSGKLQDHKAALNGLDWCSLETESGLFLRSSSDLLEKKFWDPVNKTVIKEDTMMLKPPKWTSHSCVANPLVAGLLAARYNEETEIEAIDVNPTENLVAIGDNKCRLGLCRYPCTNTEVCCHVIKSHAVTRSLRFTQDGLHILSVGGRDSCLIQWKFM